MNGCYRQLRWPYSLMMRDLVAGIVCLLLVACVSSQTLPIAGQQSFERFTVVVDFQGKPAEPVLATPLEHTYRTQIRNQMRQGPNFAGHFTVAKWGCGAPCVAFVIIDARSGVVYDPGFTVGCSDKTGGGAQVEFRLTSRLLVATGFSEKSGCGTGFYEWDGKRLKLLHFQPSPASGNGYDAARCTPKLVKQAPRQEDERVRVRPGEKPSGYSPVVAFEIQESGAVTNVHLDRSSGIREMDEHALAWVNGFRYNNRPGCGVIDTQAVVTIHLR